MHNQKEHGVKFILRMYSTFEERFYFVFLVVIESDMSLPLAYFSVLPLLPIATRLCIDPNGWWHILLIMLTWILLTTPLWVGCQMGMFLIVLVMCESKHYICCYWFMWVYAHFWYGCLVFWVFISIIVIIKTYLCK